MFTWILSKIIGSQNERELKKLQPIVDKISSLEPETQKLSDADLQYKTVEFRGPL